MSIYGTGYYGNGTYGDPNSLLYSLTPATNVIVPTLRDFFTYNGVVFNDRQAIEGYIFDNITGFEDADLRITDEENPGEDGLLPGRSHYGGRVMTMAGRIIAGDWRSLDVYEARLKAAMVKLVEKPLRITPGEKPYFDEVGYPTNLVENPRPSSLSGFDDSAGYYINPTDVGGPDFIVDTDGLEAIRFQTDSSPGQQGVQYTGLISKTFYAGKTYYFVFEARAATAGLATAFLGAGAVETGGFSTINLTTAYQQFVISWTPSADRTGVYVGMKSPNAGAANTYYMRHLLVGEIQDYFDGDTLGYKWLGDAGASESQIRVPPEVEINCRKADKLVVGKEINSLKYERPFTISLKASDPRFLSVDEKVSSVTPSVISDKAMFFNIEFDLYFDGFIDPSGNQAESGDDLVVINEGNYDSQPIIRFTGPITNPVLINNTTGHKIKINGSIAAGDYVEVDVYLASVTDAAGNNAFHMLDSSSDWVRLVGTNEDDDGVNNLSLTVTGFDTGSSVEVRFKDTWM